jgi:hypothetical protein
VLLKPMDQAEYGGTHYNPSTPEVEAEGAWVLGQPALHSETLCQKRNKNGSSFLMNPLTSYMKWFSHSFFLLLLSFLHLFTGVYIVCATSLPLFSFFHSSYI